jgi:hypothetical protein
MPLNEDQLDEPASNFTPDDMLDDIRSTVDTRLGKDSTADFSSVTLRAYLVRIGVGDLERKTVREVLAEVAGQCQDRLQRRPGSGHPDAGARAMPDDPVGLSLDRGRFDDLSEARLAIESAFRAEIDAAVGRRERRGA